MIERISPIARATASAVGPGIVARLAPEVAVPVILLATRDEALGANMRVGGLRVIDRTLRQIARLRDVKVTIVSDGSIKLPRRLPPHVEVRTTENPGALVAELKSQEEDPIVIGADVVRVQGNRLDRGTKVVDRASRRLAEDAVFEDLMRADLGLVARFLNKKISFRLTRYLLVHLPFTPNMVTHCQPRHVDCPHPRAAWPVFPVGVQSNPTRPRDRSRTGTPFPSIRRACAPSLTRRQTEPCRN